MNAGSRRTDPALGTRRQPDRWDTIQTTRTVLFVCRTLQATTRLFYDVLPLIERDGRIQVLFTVDTTSQFSGSVPRFLDSRQAKLIPWERAIDPDRFDCDLVVSAALNRNLAQLPKPLLVMAHGAGHHKFHATDTGVTGYVSGLSHDQLLLDGQVIPTRIALAGREQQERLWSSCPAAAKRSVVTGDICLERLRFNAPQRGRYRRHLGVGDEQRLIFLSSTWGPDSLLANHGGIAEHLVRQLPADEFRFIAAWHPNCWERHGHPSIAGWLGPAMRSGLMLVPPHEGWRASLLAADAVIADHGSVGFFAAALGLPVAIASSSDTETPADSPAAELIATAPRLDLSGDLSSQIRRLVGGPAPDYSTITGRALSEKMSATAELRDVMYDLVDLPRPVDVLAPGAFPVPDVDDTIVGAHHVYVNADADGITVERFPASDADVGHQRPFTNRVLVVDATETARRQRMSAAVIVWTETSLHPPEATEWARQSLLELPGAQLAAAPLADGRCLVHSRQYGGFTTGYLRHHRLATTAAVVYVTSLAAPMPGSVTYRTGRTEVTVALDPVPAWHHW